MAIEDDNIINIKAFKNRVERQVVSDFMSRGNAMSDKDVRRIQEVLVVFEQHGIGAVEALDMMQEITRIYDN